jgi:hypothetical protein
MTYGTVIVYDHGTLVSVALRLSQDFEKTFYYTPWKKDYPKSADLCVGEGFDEIIWCEDFWDTVDKEKPDLVVFTGILDGDVQMQLERMGIAVWGSRKAEGMEIYRWDMLEKMKEIGMPTPESVLVTGITALRECLYSSDDTKFVKMDANERGNIETFCYMGDQEACELSVMIPLEKELGSARESVNFIVQDPIDTIKEDGYDGFVVDGQFPSRCIYGIEDKDAAYAGMACDYDDLPEGVKSVNESLGPIMAEYVMRGQFSTEIRESDGGDAYCIDLTMRFPYPPTNCILDNWTNMSECLMQGARGIMVDPVYECKYVCELIIYSDYAKENDFKLIIPDDIKDFVKQPYVYKAESGSTIVMCQPIGNCNVGSVVSRANTLEEAKKLCLDRAGMLGGYGIKYDAGCLEEACGKLE